jgi:hypothetical protein
LLAATALAIVANDSLRFAAQLAGGIVAAA